MRVAMVAQAEVRGLSSEQVQVMRDALAAGRKPKVVFTESAGQIAGQLGQVVALTDPAESDEWVVVRFGRDELPFAPGDLLVAPKGATGRKVVPAPVVARPEPEFVMDKPVPAARSRVSPAVAAQPAADSSVPAVQGSAAPAPRKAAVRSARPRPVPGLTVTLAYAEGEWTVAAQQGSKSLAKPYVVRPAEAMRMVALVDVPGVQEAVEQIVAAERASAQQQAERLRAELAEVEARLRELTETG
ncbi:hypothetical protein [Actinoplanes sp. NPDC051859]|uniref:hypothetical protein n=1 Tax=Actinoplanes sp. NPDC051859 TaxID=3363909 RepID=UPI0037A17E3C